MNLEQLQGGRSVLFVGPDSGTSRHRALALGRLGHKVTIVDPRLFLPESRVLDSWIHHTGGLLLGALVRRRFLTSLQLATFDFVFVNGGELIDAQLVKEFRQRFGRVINYNIDDPFGKRDGKKWRHYLRSVPFYDLVVVVRECNVREALDCGASDVLMVRRAADEVAHARRTLSHEDVEKWKSDVVFIGTWMPERGPFLARLVQLGVPLAIYGDRWQKAKEWTVLQRHWRGPAVGGDDYAKAVQCSTVCLGLLSKENRDHSTTRSFEIPHLGGVLCAERTAEHQSLYEEDTEAVFWSTPEECAQKCINLLQDSQWRHSIATSGRTRCLQNRTLNECVLGDILARADAGPKWQKVELQQSELQQAALQQKLGGLS
jgi:spore maturation protein CgeB